MSTPVEDDFAAFVAARWPDLEAVALVATLDETAARDLTAACLADLRADWGGPGPGTGPTTAARRDLLSRVASHPHDPSAAPIPPPAAAGPALPEVPADEAAELRRALLDALARETPVVRAVAGARVVWQVTPDELAGLLDRSAGTVLPEVAAADERILAAHRAALAAAGRTPDDARLPDDLADAVAWLAAARPEPPDPAALVAGRAARLRRRHLLVGGGALAVAGAAAAWTLGGAIGRDGRSALSSDPLGATPTPRSTAPDSPVWATTITWPPRGVLATDTGVGRLVRGDVPGGRLVFADDVDDVRVVVALAPDPRDPRNPVLRVWAGSVGAPAEQLVPVTYGEPTFPGILDLVALGVPHPDGATLLVLARPSASAADFSPVVRPTPAGSTDRTYTGIRLADGVGHVHLDVPWGSGGRLRGSGYEGPVPVPVDWGRQEAGGLDLASSLARSVSSATGLAVRQLTSRTVVDTRTAGGVLDPDAQFAGADGRIRLATVTTPDGAVVRGVEVVDTTPTGTSVLALPAAVVPAEEAGGPAIVRLTGTPPSTGRFLVVVPGGGASAQLLATSPNAYPVSKVVPMRGETVVVAVINADQAAAFRLVVKDADGRTTYDAVPPAGRDLVDAGQAQGWLGLPREGAP